MAARGPRAQPGGPFTAAEAVRSRDVPGFRDLLPEEAEAMRATQEAVLAEMRRWGYRYVVTPTLESLDVLALGLDAEELRRLFKVADADGSLLALVGERTIPVARLVAGKLRAAPLPLRLCYAGPVRSNPPGRFTRRRASWRASTSFWSRTASAPPSPSTSARSGTSTTTAG